MTIKRRFRQLVIPFLLWALIKVFLTPPVTFDTITNIFLYPDGSFWFLWVLFIIITLFFIGDWLSELLHLKQEYVIAALALLLATVMVLFNIRLFGFQFISYYFLFYLTGYYINKYSLIINKSSNIIVLLIVWAILAWFWNMHKLPFFLSSVPLPESILQYMYRFITALVAVFVLFGIFPKLMDGKQGIIINPLGQKSLGIYTAHLIIMPSLVDILKRLLVNDCLLIMLSFSIALLISWGIVYLLSKFNVTSKLLLGKIS